MKKHFSLLLAVLFLFTAGIPMAGVYAVDLEGAGTEKSPYLITSADDFLGTAFTGGKYYKLTNSFTLPENRFIEAFAGNLDGNGQTITVNITADAAASPNLGLFGKISWNPNTIRNLTVDGSITLNGSGFVGGITGLMEGGGCAVIDCVNKADITGNTAGAAGGIVGNAKDDSTVSGCYNEGSVNGISGYAGGIAGQWSGKAGSKLNGCQNTGTIAVTGSSGSAGGIVGHHNMYLEVSLCSNYGKVSTAVGYSCAGGISGYAAKGGVIKTSYNAGEITGTNNNRVGGISGGQWDSSANSASVENCFNAGKAANGIAGKASSITSSYNAYPGYGLYGLADSASNNYNRNDGGMAAQTGVTLLTYADMLKTENYKEFDFMGTWEAGTELYPLPQLKGNVVMRGISLPEPPEAPDFASGTGTQNDPYLITSADEFKNMAKEKYTNVSVALYFKLGNNIDLTDCGYVPFIFAGRLNGGNNGKLSDGSTIENIINRASVTGSGMNVGGIIGRDFGASPSAVFRNLRNEGSVAAQGEYVGGIAGVFNHSLSNSANTGSVTGKNFVGGLIGWNPGTDAVFSSCYNTGDVTAQSETGEAAGIIEIHNGSSIQDCYNTGAVKAPRAAGIVANNWGSTAILVQNCYNMGDVRNGANFAPISAAETCTVENSYYLSPSAEQAAFGTPKTVDELKAGAALLGEAFTAGTNDYLYPQLTANPNTAKEPVFRVLTVTAGENGTAVPGQAIYVADGKTQVVAITPAKGYAIGSVKYNGTEVHSYTEGILNYETPALTADAAVEIAFTERKASEEVIPFAVPFHPAGEKYGIVFARFTALPTEYGMLISGTELSAEEFAENAEGVAVCPAVNNANEKGQYGIQFTNLASGTYYTRAYAKYAGGTVYGSQIIEITIP